MFSQFFSCQPCYRTSLVCRAFGRCRALTNRRSCFSADAGRFRLHKFEQPIGEETYTITRNGDTVTLKSNFEFTDRGTKVPLTATLRAAANYTPQSFVIKGSTSRVSTIDTDVEISGTQATIRQGNDTRTVAAPQKFLHHRRICAGCDADGASPLLARARITSATGDVFRPVKFRFRTAVLKPSPSMATACKSSATASAV